MKTYLYTIATGYRIEADNKTEANKKAEEFMKTIESASRPEIIRSQEITIKYKPEDKAKEYENETS